MKRIAVVCVSLLSLSLLGGCSDGGGSLVDKFKELRAEGVDKAATGVAPVIVFRCKRMSLEQRRVLVDAINARLEAKGEPARANALDCNGDGRPDFES